MVRDAPGAAGVGADAGGGATLSLVLIDKLANVMVTMAVLLVIDYLFISKKSTGIFSYKRTGTLGRQ